MAYAHGVTRPADRLATPTEPAWVKELRAAQERLAALSGGELPQLDAVALVRAVRDEDAKEEPPASGG